MARAEFSIGIDATTVRHLALQAAVQAMGPRSTARFEVQADQIISMATQFEAFLRGPVDLGPAYVLRGTHTDFGDAARKFTADQVRRDFARALGRCPSCGSTVPGIHNVQDGDRACADDFHAVEACPTCGSVHPAQHPAMQADGGEVQICRDAFHDWVESDGDPAEGDNR